ASSTGIHASSTNENPGGPKEPVTGITSFAIENSCDPADRQPFVRVVVQVETGHRGMPAGVEVQHEFAGQPGVVLPGAYIDPTLQLGDDLVDDIGGGHRPGQRQCAPGDPPGQRPGRDGGGRYGRSAPVDPW